MASVLALSAAALLPPTAAAAPAQAATAPHKGFVHITLNTSPRGDWLALFTDDGRVAVRLADVPKLGIVPEAVRDDLEAAREYTQGTDWVWLDGLHEHLSYELNTEEMTMALYAAPGVLGSSSVAADRGSSPRPQTDTSSAFTNYSLTTQCLDNDWSCRLWAHGEVGLNVFAAHAFSDFSYASPDRSPTRGMSYVIKDFPEHRARLQVGDVTTAGTPLGSSPLLGGVGVWTEYAVDPYFARSRLPPQWGIAETPSQVDVYVNNNLVRSVEVPAGRFEVTELVPQVGSGEVKIRVRDAYQREQVFTRSYIQPPSLLGEGVSEYGAFLGMQRDDYGERSFAYDRPALLASYRRGLAHWLTLGTSTEAALDVVQGGAETTIAFAGTTSVALHGAASFSDGGFGGAVNMGTLFLSGIWALGLDASTYTRDYETVQPRNLFGAPQLNGAAHVNVSIPDWGSASIGGSTTRYYDERMEVGTFGEVRSSMFDAVNLSLRLSLLQPIIEDEQPPLEGEAMLTLSVLLGGRLSTSSSTSADLEEQVESRLAVQGRQKGALGLVGAAGLRMRRQTTNTATSSDAELGYDATGTYRSSVGNFGLTARKTPGGASAYSARIAGGVALVGSSAFASGPIHDAFALVKVGELSDVRVYHSNREIGTTDENGEVLVPYLHSYQRNDIRVDIDDVPLGVRLDHFENTAVPGYRAGTYLDFGALRLMAVKGRFLAALEDGDHALGLGRLEIRDARDLPMERPIGTKGEFYLEDLPPGSYEATVRAAGRKFRCPFEFETGDAIVVDLGEVRCELL